MMDSQLSKSALAALLESAKQAERGATVSSEEIREEFLTDQ